MIQPIIVCLSSDDNYAQHGAVVIEGILSNHKSTTPIEIHYLDGGVANENKKKIEQVVDKYAYARIIFHTMGDAYQEFFIDRHITHAAYYRLKIADLLPHINKAIYLDTDVVVLDDIEQLWNIDMHDYSLAAVEDIGLRKGLAPTKARLNIPQEATYINSGVLVLNLIRWREKKIGETILSYLKSHPNLQYHDQDALNAVLWNDLLLIHPRWNTYKGIFLYYYKKNRNKYLSQQFIEAIKNPAIVHFTGPVKPWHYASGMPYTETYYEHLANTPWKEYIPTDKSFRSLRKRWRWKLKRFFFNS